MTAHARLPFPAPLAPAAPDVCAAHELPGLLDRFSGIELLSLDCFDTLLWRDCHAPTDVFAALEGVNPFQRVHGEQRARTVARAARGVHEVSIEDIYRAIMPRASEAERQTAIAAEIAAEARHCYAFAPTVALMRAARARGIGVIIVSDTYFNPHQLLDLIARSAGTDVAALIDRVYCSSTHGMPKAAGLYGKILPRLRVPPHKILHVGDNAAADVAGVAPFGVQTVHLRQFAEAASRQLRLESALCAIIGNGPAGFARALQPHRPALALAEAEPRSDAAQFGHATLGPVLFGFDQWLRAEADLLARERGGTVHWLFLMRDGFLPMAVHRACSGTTPGHAVEISRLTATFASFAQDTAILRHLEEQRGVDPAILGAQLRLPAAVLDRLLAGRSKAEGWKALHDWCKQPANRQTIVRAAREHATRLIAHVRAAADPAPGDTVMLVDLGYNGSVQSLVDALLARELGVHVAGRYLILREVQCSGLDKRGYLSEPHHDPALLNAMTANVALIEQLCTTARGSVIDYAADGSPLLAENAVSARQSAVRDAVQQGCIDFARTATAQALRAGSDDTDSRIARWRAANAATLLRLMFLPQADELAIVSRFEHDVNLGTGEMLALFDPAVAREGLLQQGLFYQKGVRRMFLPAELAQEGLATRLAHLVTARFPMPLAAPDFADDRGTCPVILSDGREATRVELPIRPTHDGFAALAIPVGPGRMVAAVPFGALAGHVEIHAITALPAAEYLDARHDSADRTQTVKPHLEGITALTARLWHCPDPSGVALLHAAPIDAATNLIIVVVFRTIV